MSIFQSKKPLNKIFKGNKKPVRTTPLPQESKFVKAVSKLNNFYIQQVGTESFIIFSKIIVKEHKKIWGLNVFQPFSKNEDREIPVFFLVNTGTSITYIYKEFLKRGFPVLHIAKPHVIKESEIEQLLNNFVKDTFYPD